MSVNAINYVENVNFEKLNNYNKVKTESNNPLTLLDSDVVSSKIRTVSNIARKYDVENISPRNMATMSQKLYDGGMIEVDPKSRTNIS